MNLIPKTNEVDYWTPKVYEDTTIKALFAERLFQIKEELEHTLSK